LIKAKRMVLFWLWQSTDKKKGEGVCLKLGGISFSRTELSEKSAVEAYTVRIYSMTLSSCGLFE